MRLLDSFLSLVFPPSCVHCCGEVQQMGHLFCPSCEGELAADGCFIEMQEEFKISAFFKLYVLYHYQGPAGSLVRQLKYGQQLHLAKTIAALIALEFDKQKLEIPDCIVPVPTTVLRRFTRGFNQAECIAVELGKIWKCPSINGLKRVLKGNSQAGLNKMQREKLSSENFYLVKREDLQNKHLLLLDDVMTTGTTLQLCAEVLSQAQPKKINGVAFCYSQ